MIKKADLICPNPSTCIIKCPHCDQYCNSSKHEARFGFAHTCTEHGEMGIFDAILKKAWADLPKPDSEGNFHIDDIVIRPLPENTEEYRKMVKQRHPFLFSEAAEEPTDRDPERGR